MAHGLLLPRFARILRAAQQPVSGALRPPRRNGITRRGVLAGGAAAALLAPGGALRAQQGARVAVVGGGLAGLTAAWHLRAAGHRPTVYEGTGRVGGRVRSGVGLVGPGIVTDYGGQFINSDHADLIAHAERYGIRLVDVAAAAASVDAPPSAFHLAGRVVPEAELARMLRPLAAQIGSDAARLDADWDAVAPEIDELSVADYLHRHGNLATRETRGLLAAVVRSENGVEPEACSMLSLLYSLPVVEDATVDPISASDEMYMVEGGSEAIVTALAADLGDAIRLGRRLRSIAPHGAGQRLAFRNGDVVDVDATVLAAPLTALRSIAIDVPLPPLLADYVAEVRLGRNEKVFAGYAGRPWRRPDGFATDLWTDTDATIVWDDGLRQPDSAAGAVTFFTAAGTTVRVHDDGPEQFVEEALGYYGRSMPWLAEGYTGLAGNTGWTRTPYLAGAYVAFAPGQLTRFAACRWVESDDPDEANAVAAGTLALCGEAFSDAYWGYMNGAAETGRLAAAAVSAAL